MRKLVCSAIFLGALTGAHSAGGNFGLGFVAGAPSGLSAKIGTGESNAVDLIVGWYYFRRGGVFYADADYVWYNPRVIPPVPEGKFTLYYGPGVNMGMGGGWVGIGVRFVAGVEYLFADVPFDAFFEIGPGIGVVPGIGPDFSAGLGARYFF